MEEVFHNISNFFVRVFLDHSLEFVDELLVDHAVEYFLNFSNLRDPSVSNNYASHSTKRKWRGSNHGATWWIHWTWSISRSANFSFQARRLRVVEHIVGIR
jgi:hypothetical protein